MKQLFTFIAFVTITLTGNTQEIETLKLYGYYQTVSRGKAPGINPQTGLRTSEGHGKNYFLYAVSSARIYPAEIWIEGTRMGVSVKTIQNTPVEYGDDANIGAPKKVLVPQTSRHVTQLILAPAVDGKRFGTRAETLAQNHALVLVYKQAGKFYYATLTALTALNSAAAH